MRYFAVRDKRTQRFLPSTLQTGATWWNPETDMPKTKREELPRLFPTFKSAKGFVTQWTKGRHSKDRSVSYDFEGNRDDEEFVVIEPVRGRTAEQLEIVFVHLQFSDRDEASHV